MKTIKVYNPNIEKHEQYRLDDEDYAVYGSQNWFLTKRKATPVPTRQQTVSKGIRRRFYLPRLIMGVNDPTVFVKYSDGNYRNLQKSNLYLEKVKEHQPVKYTGDYTPISNTYKQNNS